MKNFIRVMKALSDPNRVKILKLLQHRPGMCVCELQAALGIAQPTVSKHLKILVDGDLLDFSKDGLWVNYFLSDAHSSPYASVLLEHLTQWLEDDPELSDLEKRIWGVDRNVICKR